MKRVIDIILAVVGLVMCSPILLFAAILIKIESRGSIIYSQERIGKNGITFNLYKLRSMVTGAESKTGPVWAKINDSRVTYVGKIIRKLHIDEIPQMINVLIGDMSFVGPRPERPYFVSILDKEIKGYNDRHQIKPGLTGLACVSYPYGASIRDAVEKFKYDIMYMKKTGLLIDMLILLKTVKVVLTREGSG